MPALSLAYERKTSPWIILSMKALERQMGRSGRLQRQGCAWREAFPSPPPARFPGGSRRLLPTEVTSKVHRGPSPGGKGRRCPHVPQLLPGDGGCPCGEPGNPPAVLRSGRQSQRWGMPPAWCRGAGVRGTDNNKEGIWVRALAGLRWGCREGWLVRWLREKTFLGILCLRRVGRGWVAILGNRGPARLPHGNRGACLGTCLTPP